MSQWGTFKIQTKIITGLSFWNMRKITKFMNQMGYFYGHSTSLDLISKKQFYSIFYISECMGTW